MINLRKYKERMGRIFNKNGVEFAYLFGSFAYQNFTAESDIDIAVYLKEKGTTDFFEKRMVLILKLSRLFKKEADIIILNSAPIFLKYVVLQEGKLIFEKNLSKRIDFEMRILNEYSDYSPTLKLYNQRLLSA